MTMVRLKKHEQGLLCQVWPGMPANVKCQLTQESVRNLEIPPEGIDQAVGAIAKQRATCGCKARCRRLDTLLRALHSPASR
jgi:hypothetical protein